MSTYDYISKPGCTFLNVLMIGFQCLDNGQFLRYLWKKRINKTKDKIRSQVRLHLLTYQINKNININININMTGDWVVSASLGPYRKVNKINQGIFDMHRSSLLMNTGIACIHPHYRSLSTRLRRK